MNKQRIVVYKVVNNRTVPLSIEQGQDLPKGYYYTECEALKVYNDYLILFKAEHAKLEQQALTKFQALQVLYGDFITKAKQLDCSIYADGEASDDTGLDTYLTVEITVKGTYSHAYLFKLDH